MGESLLARLTRVAALRRAALAAKRLWKRTAFAPLHALRKGRLRDFGFNPNAPALPVAKLRVHGGCGCRSDGYIVAMTVAAIGNLARVGPASRTRRAFAETAAIIDLARHPTQESWLAAVAKLTQGKYRRSANKARRLGYSSRLIGLESYAKSVYALTASKPRRSKGLFVWAALAGPRADLVDSKTPHWWHSCPRHGRVAWGGFRGEGARETLAAYALLVRSGDLVWIQSFIGHGDALADGVTKMLMFDVMAWLLAREDAFTQGARWLMHGSIEEGGMGLCDWKRYLGFQPTSLEVEDAALT